MKTRILLLAVFLLAVAAKAADPTPWAPANPFGIPTYVSVTYTYVASGVANDDNIATATYKNGSGTTVAILTFTYVGSTNNVATIVRTQ